MRKCRLRAPSHPLCVPKKLDPDVLMMKPSENGM